MSGEIPVVFGISADGAEEDWTADFEIDSATSKFAPAVRRSSGSRRIVQTCQTYLSIPKFGSRVPEEDDFCEFDDDDEKSDSYMHINDSKKPFIPELLNNEFDSKLDGKVSEANGDDIDWDVELDLAEDIAIAQRSRAQGFRHLICDTAIILENEYTDLSPTSTDSQSEKKRISPQPSNSTLKLPVRCCIVSQLLDGYHDQVNVVRYPVPTSTFSIRLTKNRKQMSAPEMEEWIKSIPQHMISGSTVPSTATTIRNSLTDARKGIPFFIDSSSRDVGTWSNFLNNKQCPQPVMTLSSAKAWSEAVRACWYQYIRERPSPSSSSSTTVLPGPSSASTGPHMVPLLKRCLRMMEAWCRDSPSTHSEGSDSITRSGTGGNMSAAGHSISHGCNDEYPMHSSADAVRDATFRHIWLILEVIAFADVSGAFDLGSKRRRFKPILLRDEGVDGTPAASFVYNTNSAKDNPSLTPSMFPSSGKKKGMFSEMLRLAAQLFPEYHYYCELCLLELRVLASALCNHLEEVGTEDDEELRDDLEADDKPGRRSNIRLPYSLLKYFMSLYRQVRSAGRTKSDVASDFHDKLRPVEANVLGDIYLYIEGIDPLTMGMRQELLQGLRRFEQSDDSSNSNQPDKLYGSISDASDDDDDDDVTATSTEATNSWNESDSETETDEFSKRDVTTSHSKAALKSAEPDGHELDRGDEKTTRSNVLSINVSNSEDFQQVVSESGQADGDSDLLVVGSRKQEVGSDKAVPPNLSLSLMSSSFIDSTSLSETVDNPDVLNKHTNENVLPTNATSSTLQSQVQNSVQQQESDKNATHTTSLESEADLQMQPQLVVSGAFQSGNEVLDMASDVSMKVHAQVHAHSLRKKNGQTPYSSLVEEVLMTKDLKYDDGFVLTLLRNGTRSLTDLMDSVYRLVTTRAHYVAKARSAFVFGTMCSRVTAQEAKAESILFEGLVMLTTNIDMDIYGADMPAPVMTPIGLFGLEKFAEVLIGHSKVKFGLLCLESAVEISHALPLRDERRVLRRLSMLAKEHRDIKRALVYHGKILHIAQMEGKTSEFVYVTDIVSRLFIDAGETELAVHCLRVSAALLSGFSIRNIRFEAVNLEQLPYCTLQITELLIPVCEKDTSDSPSKAAGSPSKGSGSGQRLLSPRPLQDQLTYDSQQMQALLSLVDAQTACYQFQGAIETCSFLLSKKLTSKGRASALMKMAKCFLKTRQIALCEATLDRISHEAEQFLCDYDDPIRKSNVIPSPSSHISPSSSASKDAIQGVGHGKGHISASSPSAAMAGMVTKVRSDEYLLCRTRARLAVNDTEWALRWLNIALACNTNGTIARRGHLHYLYGKVYTVACLQCRQSGITLPHKVAKENEFADLAEEHLRVAFRFFRSADDVLHQVKTVGRLIDLQVSRMFQEVMFYGGNLSTTLHGNGLSVMEGVERFSWMQMELAGDMACPLLLIQSLIHCAEISLLMGRFSLAERAWMEAKLLLTNTYLHPLIVTNMSCNKQMNQKHYVSQQDHNSTLETSFLRSRSNIYQDEGAGQSNLPPPTEVPLVVSTVTEYPNQMIHPTGTLLRIHNFLSRLVRMSFLLRPCPSSTIMLETLNLWFRMDHILTECMSTTSGLDAMHPLVVTNDLNLAVHAEMCPEKSYLESCTVTDECSFHHEHTYSNTLHGRLAKWLHMGINALGIQSKTPLASAASTPSITNEAHARRKALDDASVPGHASALYNKSDDFSQVTSRYIYTSTLAVTPPLPLLERKFNRPGIPLNRRRGKRLDKAVLLSMFTKSSLQTELIGTVQYALATRPKSDETFINKHQHKRFSETMTSCQERSFVKERHTLNLTGIVENDTSSVAVRMMTEDTVSLMAPFEVMRRALKLEYGSHRCKTNGVHATGLILMEFQEAAREAFSAPDGPIGRGIRSRAQAPSSSSFMSSSGIVVTGVRSFDEAEVVVLTKFPKTSSHHGSHTSYGSDSSSAPSSGGGQAGVHVDGSRCGSHSSVLFKSTLNAIKSSIEARSRKENVSSSPLSSLSGLMSALRDKGTQHKESSHTPAVKRTSKIIMNKDKDCGNSGSISLSKSIDVKSIDDVLDSTKLPNRFHVLFLRLRKSSKQYSECRLTLSELYSTNIYNLQQLVTIFKSKANGMKKSKIPSKNSGNSPKVAHDKDSTDTVLQDDMEKEPAIQSYKSVASSVTTSCADGHPVTQSVRIGSGISLPDQSENLNRNATKLSITTALTAVSSAHQYVVLMDNVVMVYKPLSESREIIFNDLPVASSLSNDDRALRDTNLNSPVCESMVNPMFYSDYFESFADAAVNTSSTLDESPTRPASLRANWEFTNTIAYVSKKCGLTEPPTPPYDLVLGLTSPPNPSSLGDEATSHITTNCLSADRILSQLESSSCGSTYSESEKVSNSLCVGMGSLLRIIGLKGTLFVINLLLAQEAVLFLVTPGNEDLLQLIASALLKSILPLQWTHLYLPMIPIAFKPLLLEALVQRKPFLIGTYNSMVNMRSLMEDEAYVRIGVEDKLNTNGSVSIPSSLLKGVTVVDLESGIVVPSKQALFAYECVCRNDGDHSLQKQRIDAIRYDDINATVSIHASGTLSVPLLPAKYRSYIIKKLELCLRTENEVKDRVSSLRVSSTGRGARERFYPVTYPARVDRNLKAKHSFTDAHREPSIQYEKYSNNTGRSSYDFLSHLADDELMKLGSSLFASLEQCMMSLLKAAPAFITVEDEAIAIDPAVPLHSKSTFSMSFASATSDILMGSDEKSCLERAVTQFDMQGFLSTLDWDCRPFMSRVISSSGFQAFLSKSEVWLHRWRRKTLLDKVTDQVHADKSSQSCPFSFLDNCCTQMVQKWKRYKMLLSTKFEGRLLMYSVISLGDAEELASLLNSIFPYKHEALTRKISLLPTFGHSLSSNAASGAGVFPMTFGVSAGKPTTTFPLRKRLCVLPANLRVLTFYHPSDDKLVEGTIHLDASTTRLLVPTLSSNQSNQPQRGRQRVGEATLHDGIGNHGKDIDDNFSPKMSTSIGMIPNTSSDGDWFALVSGQQVIVMKTDQPDDHEQWLNGIRIRMLQPNIEQKLNSFHIM